MGLMGLHVAHARQVDRTKNGFLANFQTSVRKTCFHQLGGALLGKPEVISTCGFHFWKLETQLRGVTEPDFPFSFPLPVSRVTKFKMRKSLFVKTGHVRSQSTAKPEAEFARSLRSLTADGQQSSELKIVCRSDNKWLFGDFSNMVNFVITCPTSGTSADLTGLLWH